MRSAQSGSLHGEIFEEYTVLSIDELSRLCAVDRTYIVELVEEGVLNVIEFAPEPEWRFSGTALRRARTALRLQRDLEINLPGVALALQLMEELAALRRGLPAHSR
jgi:chaperone modulatory protein CbpM